MQFKRFFAAVGIPFLVGTLLAAWSIHILPIILVLCAVSVIASAFLVKRCYRTIVVIAIIFGALGCLSYWIKFKLEAVPISALNEQEATVMAEISEVIREGAGSSAYRATITSHPFTGVPKRFTVNIYSPSALGVTPYDSVVLTVKFFDINSTSTFDTKQYYQSQNIHIFAYAKGAVKYVIPPEYKPIGYYLSELNHNMRFTISSKLSKESAGMVNAMLLGDKDGISEVNKYYLVTAGIIHLTAVSGLHVSIIAGIVLLILRWFKLSGRTKAITVCVFVWTFVGLSGFNISAVRAGIMFSVMQLAALTRRQNDAVNSLFLAAMVIVLSNPFAIMDIGFQLTFTCTLGIVLFAKPVSRKICEIFNFKRSGVQALVDGIAVTIAVTFASLPILIAISGGVQIASPLINMIVLPYAPVILVGALLLCIIGAIPQLVVVTDILATLIEFIVEMILKLSQFVSSHSSLFFGLDYPYVGAIIAVTIACMVFAALFYKRALSSIVCLGLLTLVWVPVVYQIVNVENSTLTAFSSYNGSAVVALMDGKATVVLAQSDGYLCNTVANYLRGKNVSVVTNLVVLGTKSHDITDIENLMKTHVVEKIIAHEQNTVLEAFMPIHFNEGTYIKMGEMRADSSGVMMDYASGTVVITNDSTVAKEAACDILIWHKTDEFPIGSVAAPQVITLSELPTGLSMDTIDGTKNQVVLVIDEENIEVYI